jgi:hypothetical protein
LADNIVSITVTSKDTTQAGIDSVNKRIKGIGDSAKGILTADLFRDAAAGAKDFVSSTVEAASSLGESVNAVQKVFGSSAKQIEDWGKTNAESFGLSQRAFNEAITPLGSLLKNTGMDMGTVSARTIDLTKRAADMASVFNTSVPQALEAIQAGLRGESDPLEKYGVTLSAAAVQAEALAETHKQAAKALTTTELATARVNLIMKQTSSTAGDFQQTSNGLANSQRIMAAQVEDAKAKLGAGFLPVLAKAAAMAGDAAAVFAKMPGPFQATAFAALALGAAVVILAPRVIAAKEAFGKLGEGALSADTKMGKLARSAGIVSIALAAVQVAAASLGHSDTTGVNETTKALKDMADAGTKTSDVTKHLDYDLGTLGSGGMAKSGNAIAGFTENLTGLGSVFDESLQHASERISSIDAALASMVNSGDSAGAAKIFDYLAQQAQKAGISIDDLKAGLPQYQDAISGAAKGTQDAGNAASKAAVDFMQLNNQFDKATNSLLDMYDAEANNTIALQGLADAFKQNGKTLDANNIKGAQNVHVIDDIIRGYVQQRDKAIAAGNGTAAAYRQAQDVYNGQLRALETLLSKLLGSKAAAKAFMDQFYDKSITITTHLNTVVHQTTQGTMPGHFNAHGGVTGAAASGGVRSNRTVVGEAGPEVVDLPPGATVHTTGDSARMLAGMGGGGVQVVKLVIDSSGAGDFGRALAAVIRDYVHVQGGDGSVLGIS